MSIKVDRPEGTKSKINSKNEFELCYLRHRYLRKTTTNPTSIEMEPYFNIVKKITAKSYYTYKPLFEIIGFDKEDLVAIGRVHIISFLGLFSVESMPEKFEVFRESFKSYHIDYPEEDDILSKNKANFTSFLKQRMEDVVRICRQKARNIRGASVENLRMFFGAKKPPKNLSELVEAHENFGYRKMDAMTFRAFRKKAKTKENVFLFEGIWYVGVPVNSRNLNLTDFTGAGLDPYDNIHNMTPEKILENNQQEQMWAVKSEHFKSFPKEKRVEMIKDFVKNNKNNPLFKEEVRTASRVLKRMGK